MQMSICWISWHRICVRKYSKIPVHRGGYFIAYEILFGGYSQLMSWYFVSADAIMKKRRLPWTLKESEKIYQNIGKGTS